MGGCESTASTAVVNGAQGRHATQRAHKKLAEAPQQAGVSAAETAELEKAATKIQATFRGHHARQQLKQQQLPGGGAAAADEISQIDLADPELQAAATRIQASFRGHQVRRDGVLQQREEQMHRQMEELHTQR